MYFNKLLLFTIDYTTSQLHLPLNIEHSNRHARISYRSNDFSILYFCPFKSFCFSYRLFRSLQSCFMRSNCARTPSRQSGFIFLYSPVKLRIVLLFSFICSEKHTQSIRIIYVSFVIILLSWLTNSIKHRKKDFPRSLGKSHKFNEFSNEFARILFTQWL